MKKISAKKEDVTFSITVFGHGCIRFEYFSYIGPAIRMICENVPLVIASQKFSENLPILGL